MRIMQQKKNKVDKSNSSRRRNQHWKGRRSRRNDSLGFNETKTKQQKEKERKRGNNLQVKYNLRNF